MSFLAPAYFAFLAFIPLIILFYMLKKKYREQTVPSTMLWEELKREREAKRPWQKLRHHWLLYLQLLFVLLMALVLARPFVWQEGSRAEELVAVLDVSASMLAEDKWEEAKRELSAWAGRMRSGQSMSVIAAGREPAVIVSRATTAAEVEKGLADLTVDYGGSRMQEALTLGAALIRDASAGELVVLTDRDLRELLASATLRVPVRVIGIGSEQPQPNAAIEQFGVKGETAVAVIVNHGERELDGVDIRIESEGEEAAAKRISLGPGERRTVFFDRLPAADAYTAVIEPPDSADSFKEDNLFYAVSRGDSVIRAEDVTGDANPFVKRVLSLLGVEVVQAAGGSDSEFHKGEDASFMLVEGRPPEQWPAGNLLVINPPSPSEPQKQALQYRPEIALSDHPLVSYAPMEEVYVAQASRFDAASYGETIVKSGDIPLISAGLSQGRKIVLINFDLADSDFPLQTAFPVFLSNAVGWLTEDAATAGHFTAGERALLSLSPDTQRAWLESPSGKRTDIAPVQAQVPVYVPNEPGIYRLHQESGDAEQVQRLAVNMNREELAPAAPVSFTMQPSDNGEQTIREAAADQVPREIWHWIALAALLVLLVEWEVYRYGY